jgi:hypothetical protein
MPIKVLLPSIDNEKIQEILDFYNLKKSSDEEPLELLNRCESGFKIQISYMKGHQCDENKKIKQLRWSNGYLVSQNKNCIVSQNYIGFTEKEQLLLYNSLVTVLGANNVLLFE